MHKLYRGDCIQRLDEALDGIDRKRVVVVTDPPYGIKHDVNYGRFGRGHRWTKPIHGDDRAFDPATWLAFRRGVLWGGNFMGVAGGKLVWVKKSYMSLGGFCGDAEIASVWPSKAVHVFYHQWNGNARSSEFGEKHHPTQKPVALMSWCLDRLKLKPGDVVLDPYMGSGPVGVACVQRRIDYIGIEIDPEYFKTARRRIGEASRALRKA